MQVALPSTDAQRVTPTGGKFLDPGRLDVLMVAEEEVPLAVAATAQGRKALPCLTRMTFDTTNSSEWS
jgi:hypothetical protein